MYEIIDQLNSSKQRKNSSSQHLNTEHRTDQCKLTGKQFVSNWYQLEQIKGTHSSKLGLAGYFSKIRGKISSRLNGMQTCPQDSKLVHKKKGVAVVQEKAVQLTKKKRLVLFKSDRENDFLSGALGNAEHTGRIHGVASQMLYKVGFPNDAWSYKKHDRYKRNLEDAIEEKMNSMFETKSRSYMQSLAQKRPFELQQITQNPSPPPHLSSIGSIEAIPMWYPIDDIMGDMPCRLHIPIGRVGNKTKEVVIGVAMSGRVFHNNPILAEYAKVFVREITDMACIDYPLDHVTPKGIKGIGEVVNQFILWNRREIILDGPTTPQNQLMLPLS
jgi:hypothetical protein